MQKLMQQENECIDDYVSRLKLQAYKCQLRDDEEIQTRVIEQLIAGTRHADLQKDLLQKPITLTIEQALELGRTHEASLAHMKDLAELQTPGAAAAVTVDAIRRKSKLCPLLWWSTTCLVGEMPCHGRSLLQLQEA